MAEQAKVTSIDALESFRAKLILFLNAAHTRLDEVGDEVRRTRMWVQSDQRMYWEREIRRRGRDLDQARQELMSAKMAGLQDNILVQMRAVRKAREALDEAEQKLRNVKRWGRDFEAATGPLLKRLEGLRAVLDGDMPKGIAYLLEAQKTLEAYAETGMAGVPAVAGERAGADEDGAAIEAEPLNPKTP
jgi:hypothetical protein